jgi:hypothetical protein
MQKQDKAASRFGIVTRAGDIIFVESEVDLVRLVRKMLGYIDLHIPQGYFMGKAHKTISQRCRKSNLTHRIKEENE